MPKRTIKTGIGSYVNKDGLPTHGFQGEEVEVHPDHVDRFDENNVQPGGDEPHDPPKEAVSMYVSPAAGAETSGTNSGLNTTVEADESDAGDKPARSRRR